MDLIFNVTKENQFQSVNRNLYFLSIVYPSKLEGTIIHTETKGTDFHVKVMMKKTSNLS